MSVGSTLSFRGGANSGTTRSKMRVPNSTPDPKMRAVLGVANVTIKCVAVFALVAFLYTAGARDGAVPVIRAARSLQSFVAIAERRADWDSVPKHCAAIRRKPIPFDKQCKRKGVAQEGDNFQCEDGRTVMFSQFRQDYYLYKYHFAKLNRPGNYLDVAANEPIGLSNTFFFDRCLRWSGICVEGNPRYFEKLHRLRSCRLLPTCVGEIDGQSVEFILKGGSGGIESTNKALSHWKSMNETIRKTKVRCTTLKKELRRTRVREIDYLSLDVEGHELYVLRGIDWTAVKINVMTVEVSKKTYEPIRDFLESVGYTEIMELPDGVTPRYAFGGDVLFVHRDVTFGSPV